MTRICNNADIILLIAQKNVHKTIPLSFYLFLKTSYSASRKSVDMSGNKDDETFNYENLDFQTT
jgi:hypothetical protein